MYKCCWNCWYGLTGCTQSPVETERLRVSKRICDAPHPVSSHLQNPFQRRYCKQFSMDGFPAVGHYINKQEAEKLNCMTVDELLEYWED